MLFVEGIAHFIYKADQTSSSADMYRLNVTARKTGTGHSDQLDHSIEVNRLLPFLFNDYLLQIKLQDFSSKGLTSNEQYSVRTDLYSV